MLAWVLRGGSCVALAGALVVACSGAEDSLGGPVPIGGDGDGDGDLNIGDGDGDGIDPNEPETEVEASFRAPVVVGKYLFSANPDSNRVARIDVVTQDIEVYEGGHAPTYLAALPSASGPGGALVLNTRSRDASIFVLAEDGSLARSDKVSVQEGASAWSVGAAGQFAIAWSRASDGLLDALDGYQDLTVLDLRADDPESTAELESTALSVGFRPSQVVINDAETFAYVVSDPGISVIALGDDVGVVRELFLPEVDGTVTRDVSITPDGRLAFVRLSGESEILLVDTETNDRVTVELPQVVTDLDLSVDGSTAVAVMRGGQVVESGIGGAGGESGEPVLAASAIALLPVDSIFEDPTSYGLVATDEVVGSAVISDDASQVALFTNAVDNHHMTILTTASGNLRVVDLKAPVYAAFLSEDGEYGVALMKTPAGSNRAGAFALVPVAKPLAPRIEGTAVVPKFVSLSAAAGRALVTTDSTAQAPATAYFARFPGLQVDEFELPSRPLASGIVTEASQGFVAQEHNEGRVTLFDLDSGSEKTITGFELSSKVVD